MKRKYVLVTGGFFLAWGTAVTAAPSVVAIDSASSPPADVVAIPAGSQERALRELPQVITDIMKRSHVPGMAVAVVMNGETVFSQGFGTRDVRTSAPVDAQTVFQIASISKSLSATVAAIEVSKGKVAWDDPVARYLPDFRLRNVYVSEQATIGDFFAHRTGLPGTAGDDLEDLGFTRDEVIARLHLLPLSAFRTSYHYANFSTTIGAQAVAKTANQPWETLADNVLLTPLKMSSTSYRYGDFKKHENRAALHAYLNGEFVPVAQRDADEQAPAGGVSSTVGDLTQWLKLLLADGQVNGNTMIDADALLPALSAQAFSARAHDLDSRAGFYGYGFNVNTELGGRPSMGHSGAFLAGAGTSFRIVPSAGMGIVVLTNGAPVGAAESVVATFMDTALYGQPTRDWYAAYNGVMKGFFEPQADLSGQPAPVNPAPSQALAQYVGTFENAYYGPAQIQQSDGGLTLTLGPKGMHFPLKHWDGNTFAFSPAGEAELVASSASMTFTMQSDKATGFEIKFYDDNGLGNWVRK